MNTFSSQKLSTGATLTATILLTACASTGGLQTRSRMLPTSSVATTQSLSAVTYSEAAWPKNNWWTTAYGDAQLDQLIADALRGQPTLSISAARVRQAAAAGEIAASALYPQIDAGVKVTEQRFSENSTYPKNLSGHVNTINDGSLGLHYELDFWGKNKAAFDAALDRAQAAEVDFHTARLLLTTALVRTYIRLGAAFEQRDLAADTLRQREQILTLTQARVSAQIDSQLELTQAQAALPAVRERMAMLDESIALIRNQLAALEGKGPDGGLAIARPQIASASLAALPTDFPVELIGRRPDVVAERWRVEAAAKDVHVAEAQFYPNVSINAFVGLQSIGLEDFLTGGSRALGIGPAISLPIFNAGRLRNNLALNQSAYDGAVEKYNSTLISAVHDVVEQVVSLCWLAQQMQEQNNALHLSQHAYDLAKRRYRSGLANYLQVLSAESQVLDLQRATVESRARNQELRLNLIRALGGGELSS